MQRCMCGFVSPYPFPAPYMSARSFAVYRSIALMFFFVLGAALSNLAKLAWLYLSVGNKKQTVYRSRRVVGTVVAGP